MRLNLFPTKKMAPARGQRAGACRSEADQPTDTRSMMKMRVFPDRK